jgi:hypothetical protein
MGAIQSRFEVAVPELPSNIDPASYSKLLARSLQKQTNGYMCSDLMRPYFDTIPTIILLSNCSINLYGDPGSFVLRRQG